jgi:hypothetical protein
MDNDQRYNGVRASNYAIVCESRHVTCIIIIQGKGKNMVVLE